MESTCRDKKFQSSWKLSPSADLERKDSPMNPYYRSVCATHPKLTPPNVNNDDNGDSDGSDVVGILPEFEQSLFYSNSCSCCLQEIPNRELFDKTIVTKHHDCCKEDWARKAAYQKIKAKAKRAVKVSAFEDWLIHLPKCENVLSVICTSVIYHLARNWGNYMIYFVCNVSVL